MSTEFLIRLAFTLLPIFVFGIWLETRDFRRWERWLLSLIFAIATFVVYDEVRAALA